MIEHNGNKDFESWSSGSSRAGSQGSGHEHEMAGAARPEEIERSIGETRAAIGEDLRALSDRLSPEHLKEGAKEMAKEAVGAVVEQAREVKERAHQRVSEGLSHFGDQAKRAGNTAIDMMGKNAVPLTLIGLGVGWMTVVARRERAGGRRSMDFGDYPRSTEAPSSRLEIGEQRSPGAAGRLYHAGVERMEELEQSASDALDDMRDKARTKAHAIGDRARELGSETRERARRSARKARDFADDNPFAVAAAAAVCGIGIGLLVPVTAKETKLLGETGQRIQGRARRALEQGREAARHIASSGRETVSETKEALRPGS